MMSPFVGGNRCARVFSKAGSSLPPELQEPIDVKVVVQFIMRIDQATRLAIGSRERWETGLRVVARTGDQLRVRRPFQRSG